VQIVSAGGLTLLLPLTESSDIEVQRLAAHCLANLSVNGGLCTLCCVCGFGFGLVRRVCACVYL
jgi:hypothetical protein